MGAIGRSAVLMVAGLAVVATGACDSPPVRQQQREHCRLAAERSLKDARRVEIQRLHDWEIEDTRNVSVIATGHYANGSTATNVVKCRYARTPGTEGLMQSDVIKATEIAVNGVPMGRTELGLYNSAIKRSM